MIREGGRRRAGHEALEDGAPRVSRRDYPSTVAAVVAMIIFLSPIYWMLNVSVQKSGSAVMTPLIPLKPVLSGYARAMSTQGPHLLISLVVALGTVFLTLLLAAPAAFALARFKIPGGPAFLLVVLVSQMIPSIVVANALYTAYNALGMLNSIPGLILADATLGVPFAILIMTAGMRTVSPSLIEAGEIDGAGMGRIFWSIVLPVTRNSLITAGLFTFLFAFGDFLFALTLTTSPDIRPVTLSLYTYMGGFVQDWSAVMATAVLASVPAILLLIFAQRFVAAGVNTGSVK